jgi:hypothetical protein
MSHMIGKYWSQSTSGPFAAISLGARGVESRANARERMPVEGRGPDCSKAMRQDILSAGHAMPRPNPSGGDILTYIILRGLADQSGRRRQ